MLPLHWPTKLTIPEYSKKKGYIKEITNKHINKIYNTGLKKKAVYIQLQH